MLARTARPARCQDPLPNNAVRAVARQRAIRGIHRHHFALVHAQLDRLDRQIRHAPGVGPVEQIIQGELAPLHRPLDPMPPPLEMEDEGQGRAGQAAFALDQAPGHHR